MPVAITLKLIAATTTAALVDRKRRELIDAKAPGLILRIGPRDSKWSWKVERLGRTQRLELGPLSELSIDEARALATEASGMVKSKLGFPTAEWLLERRMRYGKVPRPIRAAATSPMEFARYDFGQARAAYLAHVERTRRGDTHRDYAQLLGIPELEALVGVKVARISRRQMSKIVEAIHTSGTERKAEKVAGVLRTMWGFLARDNEL
ncbi:MAG TPA: Arm DNA-binding domain-containing protein, partial [Devosia sp.]|nr:Arm DNA-binding domain-containing protein [Devosia sp.]